MKTRTNFFGHLGRAVVAMILCAAMVSLSMMPAFASSTTINGENALMFSSIEDIATDKVCVLVFGDMTQNGADSEGRAIIGGDLTVTGGWSASVKEKFNNDYALIVGGNVEITSGNLDIGGCFAQNAGKSVSGSFSNSNCCAEGNSYVHKVSSGWIDSYIQNAEVQFKSASKSYSQKTANGTITSDNWGDIEPGSDHVAGTPHVFKTSSSNIAFNFGKGYSAYGGDSIIINIPGKNVTINGSNYNGNDKAEFCSHTIWNCYEAETVTVFGAIQGSLLAPYATVNGSYGHVNGTTIVQNLNGLGGFEYHTGQFFRDPFSASLKVTKNVVGESSTDESFGFALYELVNGSWSVKENFTLKGGETAAFSDLIEGHTFKVVETNPGSDFSFVSVTGGDTNDQTERSASFTVTTTNHDVVFTNERQKGSITVSKTLNDTLDPAAQFKFTVEQQNGSQWSNVDEFYLGNGQSKTVENLSIGTYRVTEEVNSNIYDTTVNGEIGTSAQIALGSSSKNANVSFNNSRKTAAINVYKELKAGDIDTGETYTFTISGPDLEDTFELKAGAHKTYTGLIGADYTVKEIDSGATYTLYSDPTGGSPVNLQQELNLTFVNAKVRQGIKVTKLIEGEGGNPNDEFTFTIKGNGVEETFTLKPGETKIFEGLPVGEKYTITETAYPTKYTPTRIDGGTVNGNSTVIPAQEGSATTFYSKVLTGSITVTKKYEDLVEPNKTFTFNVTDENGNTIKSVTLANGESATVSDLTYGKTYYVSESVSGSIFSTEYALDGSASTAGTTAAVVVGGDHSIVFTNTRKTVKLSVYKQLKDGDIYTGEVYKFNIKGPGLDKDFDLAIDENGGKNVITFNALVGGKYTVTELSSGTSYVLDSVTANGSAIGNGEAVNIAEEMKLVYTNTLKKGSIYVYKELADEFASEASFTFTLQRKENNAWVDVAQHALANKEGYEFSGLPYGYEYRVVENVDSSIYDTAYSVYNNVTLSDKSFNCSGNAASGNGGASAAFTLDSAMKAVLFTNERKVASLTVSKALTAGSSNLGETFTLQLYRFKDGSWEAYGSPFTLTAGTSKTFSGLAAGVKYCVIETSTGASYTFDSIEGATPLANQNGGAFILTGEKAVTLYNKTKSGEITVTKTLSDPSEIDADKNAKFSFAVYAQGEDSNWSLYDSFELGNGESKTISGIEFGTVCKVVETAGTNYTTTVKVASDKEKTAADTGSFTVDGSMQVNFTNTRKTAAINVYKTLKDGDVDTGEQYTFTIKGAGLDETFTLKANDHKSFTGLVGADYVVTETNSGKTYTLYSDPTGGSAVNLQKEMNLTFVNAKVREGITVKKTVNGKGGNPDDEFTFTIKGNGINDTFKLKAGESKVFENLPVGESYTITEVEIPTSYEFAKVNGYEANGTSVVATAANGAVVEFVNNVRTGSITFSKAYEDKVDPDAKFTFNVTDENGAVIATEALGNGESKTIGDLPYGHTYTISEVVDDKVFTTTVTSGDSTSAASTAKITVAGDHNVVFTNVRKTAKLVVYKTLKDGDVYTGETYDFNIKGVDLDENFTLGCDQYKSFDCLVGGDYTITETSIGKNYVLSSDPTGGKPVNICEEMQLKFVNSIRTTKLTVKKQLVDEINPNAEFEVKAVITDAEGNVTTKTGTISSSKECVFDDIPYASTVVVTETADNSTYTTTYYTDEDCKTEGNTIVTDKPEKVIVVKNVRRNASVTITKAIANGSKVNDEEFTFALYEGGTLKEEFTLTADESKTIEGLTVGAKYTVVETGTGASYSFKAVEGGTSASLVTNNGDTVYGSEFVLGKDGQSVKFINESKRSGLTVRKIVTDGKNYGDSFHFEIYKNGASEPLYVKVAADGTATVSETGSGKTGFNLSAGQSVNFKNLEVNDKYSVEETTMGSHYEFLTVEGGVVDASNAQKSTVVISDQPSELVFTNTLKKGSIYVHKNLSDKINPNASFSFTLQRFENGAWVDLATASIAAGQGKQFNNLTYGYDYRVVEAVDESLYSTSYNIYKDVALDGDSISSTGSVASGNSAMTDSFSLDEPLKVVLYNNVRKTASISVTKALTAGTTDLGEAFTMQLQRYVGGKWENCGSSFQLAVGETKTISGLEVGVQYKVMETGAGNSYEFDSFNGTDANGVIELTGDADVTVINKSRLGSVTVKKTLNDTSDIAEDQAKTFTFAVYTMVDGAWVLKDSFQLGNNDTRTVSGIAYGTVCKVVETAGSNYTTTYAVANDKAADGTETKQFTVNGDVNVEYVNTRKTAAINVYKELQKGDIDTGEEYKFSIKGAGLDEEFTLKAGKHTSFTGLVGAEYVVTELSSGNTYMLVSDPTGGAPVNLKEEMDLKFVNAKIREGITVKKLVEGAGANPDDKFIFNIKGEGIDQTIYLKAGESYCFEDLPLGEKYVVTELNIPANYELSSIEGGDVNKATASTSIEVSEGAEVVFTNKVRTGSITLKKVYEDVVQPNAKFSFTVTDENGAVVETAELGNGETATIDNLPFGKVYTVTETVDGNTFTTTAKVDDESAKAGASVNVTIGGEHNVVFTNTRKTAELVVYKSLSEGSVNTGEVYEFNINGADLDKNFTLYANKYQSFNCLVGGDYTITETSSGKNYELAADPTGGKPVNICEEMKLEFVNAIKTTKLVVKKALVDTLTPNAEFVVNAVITDAEGNVTTKTGTVSANKDCVFDNIPYASSVVVTETVDDNTYTTTYYTDENCENEGNTITADADEKVIVIKNVRRSAAVTVVKTIADGSKVNDEAFTFALYEYNAATDSYKKVANSEFTLTADESKTIENLTVGAQYKVIETNTGASYSFSAVEGGSIASVTTDDGSAAYGSEFTLGRNGQNVNIINETKRSGLTVRKIVEGGSIIDTDAFHFEIYKNKSDTALYVKKNADGTASVAETGSGSTGFDLTSGQAINFTNLEVSDSYTVVETTMGKRYEFGSVVGGEVDKDNAQKASVVITEEPAELAFTNLVKKGSVAITKTLKDELNSDSKFEFEAQKLDNGNWVKLDSFAIGGGETYTISNIPYGTEIRVVELNKSSDFNTSWRINDAELTAGSQTSVVSIAAESTGIEFVNERAAVPNVKLAKSVTGTHNANEEYAVCVSGIFDGNTAETTETYYFTADGKATDKAKAAKTYKLGESVELSGILSSGVYTISELGAENYNKSYTVNGSEKDGEKLSLTLAGGDAVNLNNIRKTASLTVTKALEKNSDDLGETFSFKLYRLVDDAWQSVADFDLKAGESKTFENIDAGFEYKVIETSSGENYTLSEVSSNSDLTSDSEGLGAKFVLDKDMNVVIENRIKQDGITVRKVTEGEGGNADEQFSFELYVKGDKSWEVIDSFKLKSGESYNKSALDYGKEYKVVETDSGKAYDFANVVVANAADTDKVDAAAKSATLVLNGAEEVIFTNKVKEAKIAVTKKCDATASEDDTFSFSLMKKENSSWVTVENFVLKAGETKEFAANYGVEYKVVENGSGTSYQLESIEGADSSDINSGAAFVKVDGNESIEYTNKLLTGSINVGKTVTGAMNNSEYFEFSVVDANDKPVVNEKTDKDGKFRLKNGENVTLSDLPYGSKIVISEDVDSSKYSTSYSVNGNVRYGTKTDAITIDTIHQNVIYTNAYIGTAVLGASAELQNLYSTTTTNATPNLVGTSTTPTSALQTVSQPQSYVNGAEDSYAPVTKVLGDSDTPATGDDIPVPVIVAIFVTSLVVLTFAKKAKTN